MGSQENTQETTLKELREALDSFVERLNKFQNERPANGREAALVVTKLQEARLWAGEALLTGGYVTKYEEDAQTTENV